MRAARRRNGVVLECQRSRVLAEGVGQESGQWARYKFHRNPVVGFGFRHTRRTPGGKPSRPGGIDWFRVLVAWNAVRHVGDIPLFSSVQCPDAVVARYRARAPRSRPPFSMRLDVEVCDLAGLSPPREQTRRSLNRRNSESHRHAPSRRGLGSGAEAATGTRCAALRRSGGNLVASGDDHSKTRGNFLFVMSCTSPCENMSAIVAPAPETWRRWPLKWSSEENSENIFSHFQRIDTISARAFKAGRIFLFWIFSGFADLPLVQGRRSTRARSCAKENAHPRVRAWKLGQRSPVYHLPR